MRHGHLVYLATPAGQSLWPACCAYDAKVTSLWWCGVPGPSGEPLQEEQGPKHDGQRVVGTSRWSCSSPWPVGMAAPHQSWS